MDHQDWKPILLNNTKNKINEPYVNNSHNSHKTENDIEIKMEVPKQLYQIISQARNSKKKTQKELASELGISSIILNKWESGKEVPSNNDIAKIEKILAIKLPRIKKIKSKI